MLNSTQILKDMNALYPKLKISGSKMSADLFISEQYTLQIDVDQKPEDWKVFHVPTGDRLGVGDVKGSDKLIISEFTVTYKEIAEGNVKKAQPETEIKQPEPKADQKPAHPKKAKYNQKAKSEEYLNRFGMELQIAYPPEMAGQSMKFMQWKKENNVLTSESTVLILDEDEYNYTVHIPSAHIGFTISRAKVEIVNPTPEEAAKSSS